MGDQPRTTGPKEGYSTYFADGGRGTGRKPRNGRGNGATKVAPQSAGGETATSVGDRLVASTTGSKSRRYRVRSGGGGKAGETGTAPPPSSAVEHHKGQHGSEHVRFSNGDDKQHAKPARRPTGPIDINIINGPGGAKNTAPKGSGGGGKRGAKHANTSDPPVTTALESHKGQHGDEHVRFVEPGSGSEGGGKGAKGKRTTHKPNRRRATGASTTNNNDGGDAPPSTAATDGEGGESSSSRSKPSKGTRRRGAGGAASGGKKVVASLSDRLVASRGGTGASAAEGNDTAGGAEAAAAPGTPKKAARTPRKKATTPKRRTKAPAESKAKSGAASTARKTRGPIRKVTSHCGGSFIEVEQGTRLHPIHDLTLGGQRRQRHASWHPVITPAWLGNKGHSHLDPPKRERVIKKHAERAKSESDLSATLNALQTGAAAPAGSADTTTTGTSTPKKSKKQKSQSQSATDGDGSGEAAAAAAAAGGGGEKKKKGSGPRRKRINSLCGGSSMEVDASYDPNEITDMTLGGQRRQRHSSWAPVVASPWLADVGQAHAPEARTSGRKSKEPAPRRGQISHFVSIRVTDEAIVDKLKAVQAKMLEKDPSLEAVLFEPGRFHVTLGLVEKPADSDETFEETLREAFVRCQEAAEAASKDLTLTFDRLVTPPNGASVLVDTGGDEGREKVAELARALHATLGSLGLRLGTGYQPNVTLFKTARRRGSSSGGNKIKFTQEGLEEYQPGEGGFGTQPVTAVELCVSAPTEADAYYDVVASLKV